MEGLQPSPHAVLALTVVSPGHLAKRSLFLSTPLSHSSILAKVRNAQLWCLSADMQNSLREQLQWLHIACMDVDCRLGKPFAVVLHSAGELGSGLASFSERAVLLQVQKGAGISLMLLLKRWG